MGKQLILLSLFVLVIGFCSFVSAQEPSVTDWLFGDGAKGSSQDTDIHAQVSLMDADVQEVWYNALNVYVKAESIPSHDMGDWDPRMVYPTAQDNTWIFERTVPTASGGAGDALTLAAIGVMVNGVQVFSWSDATSWNDEGNWNYIANEVRNLDDALGHPGPGMGGRVIDTHTHRWTDDPNHTHGSKDGNVDLNAPGLAAAGAYHYHSQSPALRAQLGDDGSGHSPINGWSLDGHPIYGPYGYDSPLDSGSSVVRMVSGYELRTDIVTTRVSGPTVAAEPLGNFREDYEFTGNGHLDQYNGRFCVTPEYPGGIYAYFATIDLAGESYFPYSMGPDNYRSSVLAGNSGPGKGNATIPGDAVLYVPAVTPPVETASCRNFELYF